MTECKAYLAALRILTRSDRSVADLGNRLRQRDFPDEQIEEALNRCLSLGYLDDRRLAANLARNMSESGRAVGRRLLLELKKRGIPAELAAAAVQATDNLTPATGQIFATLQRRYPGFNPRAADLAQRRRILSFFQRRGYRIEDIISAFNALAAGRTPEPNQ